MKASSQLINRLKPHIHNTPQPKEVTVNKENNRRFNYRGWKICTISNYSFNQLEAKHLNAWCRSSQNRPPNLCPVEVSKGSINQGLLWAKRIKHHWSPQGRRKMRATIRHKYNKCKLRARRKNLNKRTCRRIFKWIRLNTSLQVEVQWRKPIKNSHLLKTNKN